MTCSDRTKLRVYCKKHWYSRKRIAVFIFVKRKYPVGVHCQNKTGFHIKQQWFFFFENDMVLNVTLFIFDIVILKHLINDNEKINALLAIMLLMTSMKVKTWYGLNSEDGTFEFWKTSKKIETFSPSQGPKCIFLSL